jgi:hypothetical protein
MKLGYCALDKGRTPLTGTEERACWVRKSTEVSVSIPVIDAAAGSGDGGSGIWGAVAQAVEGPAVEGPAVEGPDKPASVNGMWTESDLLRDPEPQRHQHGGSIRPRPWGPVPGHREPATGLRGLKWPRQG